MTRFFEVKLLTTLGCILLFTLLVIQSVAEVSRLSQICQQSKKMLYENNAKTEYATAMYNASRERAIKLHQMAVFSDPFNRDQAYMEFKNLAGEFIKARSKIMLLPLTESEKSSLERILSLSGRAAKVQEQASELLLENKINEAYVLMENDIFPTQQALRDVLSHLVQLQYEANRDIEHEAMSAEQETKLTLLGLGGILLCFGLVHSRLKEAQRNSLKSMFKRYISPKLLDKILAHQGKGELSIFEQQNRQDAVILFADLRGFTAMSDQLKPKEVVTLLNEFFTMLTEVAYRHDGTIFNMAGDCLLIGFSVPFYQADAAPRAINASIDMQKEFIALDQAWRKRYGVDVGLGIGINKGEVIVGNVGSPNYLNYTVIGDTVNVASRLMGVAGRGEIILSESMLNAIRTLEIVEQIEALELVNLKGKAQAQQLYKITCKTSVESTLS
jgi:class 3 adenylate cyclase